MFYLTVNTVKNVHDIDVCIIICNFWKKMIEVSDEAHISFSLVFTTRLRLVIKMN